MSTVKISQLPFFSTINANTANTLFVGVDIPTSTTFQINAHILAQGLYSNEILNVGTNQQNLPNTIGQFSLSGDSYIQTNLVNTNDGGSADIVVTANAGSGGTDSTNFIDMGYANKNYQPGSEFNNIGTAIQPLDGYLYVQGTASSPGGNLIVGTTTAGSNLKFIVGGGTAQNVVAIMTPTGLKLNTQSSITFSDGTVQSTASNPANYSTAAFAQANAANSLAQAAYNLANTESSLTYAQAAYSQANLNTGGLISANANIALLQSYANQANANISYIFGVNAWQNTIDQIQTANIAAAFNLANTSVQNTATITVNNINVLGGLVYTPLVYPSSQTAITIDMSNNSVVRAQTATGLTVTLSNLVAGKEILVWITNTAGGNQTFTHGVSATNSTTNSTTWTIPGTSTILARYMCIDATLANTLVAITHA
jgi:hypothetical protein